MGMDFEQGISPWVGSHGPQDWPPHTIDETVRILLVSFNDSRAQHSAEPRLQIPALYSRAQHSIADPSTRLPRPVDLSMGRPPKPYLNVLVCVP